MTRCESTRNGSLRAGSTSSANSSAVGTRPGSDRLRGGDGLRGQQTPGTTHHPSSSHCACSAPLSTPITPAAGSSATPSSPCLSSRCVRASPSGSPRRRKLAISRSGAEGSRAQRARPIPSDGAGPGGPSDLADWWPGLRRLEASPRSCRGSWVPLKSEPILPTLPVGIIAVGMPDDARAAPATHRAARDGTDGPSSLAAFVSPRWSASGPMPRPTAPWSSSPRRHRRHGSIPSAGPRSASLRRPRRRSRSPERRRQADGRGCAACHCAQGHDEA